MKDGFELSVRRLLEGELQGLGGQKVADFADTVAAMEESAQRRPSIERISTLWLYRLIFTPFPLAEVMTLVWHGHYATSQAKVKLIRVSLETSAMFTSMLGRWLAVLPEPILGRRDESLLLF